MIRFSADRLATELNLALTLAIAKLVSFAHRGHIDMKKKWKFTAARKESLNQAQLIAHRMKRHEKLNKLIADRRQNNARNGQRFEAFVNG
jgi:hypothetical protein